MAERALRAVDHEVLPSIPKKGAAGVQVAVCSSAVTR